MYKQIKLNFINAIVLQLL